MSGVSAHLLISFGDGQFGKQNRKTEKCPQLWEEGESRGTFILDSIPPSISPTNFYHWGYSGLRHNCLTPTSDQPTLPASWAIKMPYDSLRALTLLRQGSGLEDASFREGQEEAIRHIVDVRGRILVVQKTGWGKSFVYFIATKLLREEGMGPALLISPLLALMRNQIAAAERMGVSAATINSDNQQEWENVEARLVRDEIDILLITYFTRATRKRAVPNGGAYSHCS